MTKTNKELAVDVAIAYIESTSNLKHVNGGSKNLISPAEVQGIIKAVHQTLDSLDK